jgi:hypothetical protein
MRGRSGLGSSAARLRAIAAVSACRQPCQSSVMTSARRTVSMTTAHATAVATVSQRQVAAVTT